ncbi:hypothetical protein L6452_22482 [Arctium lappa]|uniref:Uncharacterized protein n=1 Tax=Arctium lappa TaxID=4217 RepID=A0ACB9B099_ARCLA|nr:hypothetical protein L6452_22482 [Arctium lappa]
MIKEGGLEKKIKEVSVEDAKKKGKEKMVESEQPLKKKKQIELDEEVAKKLQEELEKEEEIQSAKDRELALDMAKKINEEYQRSLKHRRKMINFLKGALGVPEEMFTNMPYGRIEKLYKKEMDNLKGDFTQRVEAERKMKERHDLNIQQPFPDSEEGTPSKDKEERTRTEEAEKESERKEDEPPAELKQNQDHTSQSRQIDVQFDLYMTLSDKEPLKVDPISVNAPEIIHWDILKDQGKEYFRIKRLGDHYEVIKHIIRDMNHERVFRSIDHWMLIERCGVYVLSIDKRYHEYYLVDKVYDYSRAKLQGMLRAKLVCSTGSEMAKIVIRRTINQSLGLDPNFGELRSSFENIMKTLC